MGVDEIIEEDSLLEGKDELIDMFIIERRVE